ncbi:uncharacterized protein [Macrobrachium rosenbergii]|uniref:uncharacterized protein n=1 Tax=Macrobrachium rosenbergii TaxID=79674 RepID=UPI0034D6E8E7
MKSETRLRTQENWYCDNLKGNDPSRQWQGAHLDPWHAKVIHTAQVLEGNDIQNSAKRFNTFNKGGCTMSIYLSNLVKQLNYKRKMSYGSRSSKK